MGSLVAGAVEQAARKSKIKRSQREKYLLTDYPCGVE
jgi:hypothetical protein